MNPEPIADTDVDEDDDQDQDQDSRRAGKAEIQNRAEVDPPVDPPKPKVEDPMPAEGDREG
jgi:hypothetical protein